MLQSLINMPLIYGEGRKAFMRLQLEILKKYDDDSLYAWTAPLERSGLLAEWPTAFADCANITQIVFPQDYSPWFPPMMTSIGLEMRGRYRRDDQHQDALDAKYGVHTMSTAIPIQTIATLVMHCGPHKDYHLPVTQKWMRGDHGEAVVLQLRRFGAIWQRINCNQRVLTDYTMYEPSKHDAYAIYYIEQQGT